MTTTVENRSTPRAIKLTEDTLSYVDSKADTFDLPPSVETLLVAVTVPGNYYFVTDYPGVTPEKSISWAIVPDFMFEKKFMFASKPMKNQFISIIEIEKESKSDSKEATTPSEKPQNKKE